MRGDGRIGRAEGEGAGGDRAAAVDSGNGEGRIALIRDRSTRRRRREGGERSGGDVSPHRSGLRLVAESTVSVPGVCRRRGRERRRREAVRGEGIEGERSTRGESLKSGLRRFLELRRNLGRIVRESTSSSSDRNRPIPELTVLDPESVSRIRILRRTRNRSSERNSKQPSAAQLLRELVLRRGVSWRTVSRAVADDVRIRVTAVLRRLLEIVGEGGTESSRRRRR